MLTKEEEMQFLREWVPELKGHIASEQICEKALETSWGAVLESNGLAATVSAGEIYFEKMRRQGKKEAYIEVLKTVRRKMITIKRDQANE